MMRLMAGFICSSMTQCTVDSKAMSILKVASWSLMDNISMYMARRILPIFRGERVVRMYYYYMAIPDNSTLSSPLVSSQPLTRLLPISRVEQRKLSSLPPPTMLPCSSVESTSMLTNPNTKLSPMQVAPPTVLLLSPRYSPSSLPPPRTF